MEQNISVRLERLDGNIERLGEAVDRLTEELTKIDDRRLVPLEERVTKIERWQSEWSGSYKVLSILALFASIGALILNIMKK